MRRAVAYMLVLLLASCGYHLMGMGRGVVPADVQVVRIVDEGNGAGFVAGMQQFVRDHASYEVISATSEKQAGAELHISRLNESLVPGTYDATGIVSVDRLTLSGELSLWRDGERAWHSGTIAAYEDVNVSGGPTAIESAKTRIRSDVETQWMRQAWLKLSSGF